MTMATVSLGKYWAALSDGKVLGVISMSVPSDVDFCEYRLRAVACLSLLGKVKGGEVIERDGQRYFLLQHGNAARSKNPKPPKEYWLYKPDTINPAQA